MDHLAAGVGFDLRAGPYAQHDLDISRSQGAVKAALKWAEVTHVINVAGLLGTAELFDNVEGAIDVNIKGQYNVARAALDLGLPLVTIEQPHIWTNPYETTRGAGVRLARSLAHHKGLRLATVTTYNAFGERQGYGGHHPQKFIPTFAVRAWNGLPLEIYGDGEQQVNAVYAGDVARVMVEALKYAGTHVPSFLGAAYGGNFTVNEIAHMVLDVTGGGEIEYLPMRDGETDDGIGAAVFNESILNRNAPLRSPSFRYDKFARTVESYKGVKPGDIVP
jgi:UDP-glucose 4-epimerase